jgi:DNA-binding NarL/FixJ family response regulator
MLIELFERAPAIGVDQKGTDIDGNTMKHAIRILLIGRHKLMTDGLRALFESKTDFRIVGQVADGPEAIDLIGQVKPDVVVLDLLMQALDGLAAIGQIKQHAPATKIVPLSRCTDASYVSQALSNGASAYVLKSEDFDDLAHAIREVFAGRQFFSPPLDHNAIKEFQRKADGKHLDNFDTLTSRERQVLQLAIEGSTSAQIARRLGISPRTAETHRSNIYKKLHVQSRADLIALALRRGLITRDL